MRSKLRAILIAGLLACSTQAVAGEAAAHNAAPGPHSGVSCNNTSNITYVFYKTMWPAWGAYYYVQVNYWDQNANAHVGRWVCLPWEALPNVAVNVSGGGNGPH